MGPIKSKYILIKKDNENKIKNLNSTTNKISINFFKNENNVQNYFFSQKELNAILDAVGGNQNLFKKYSKKT